MWPVLRDSIRFLFIIYGALAGRKHIGRYLSQWKNLRIWTGILIVFALGMSYFKDKSLYDMFVGIKYGLLYLPIFLSATFIGHLWGQEKETKNGQSKIYEFFKWIKAFLLVTLIVGFIRQITKFIWPDLFFHIGYGPLNDFKFGVKPPIYYLTGYQGTWRRQGIFS
jgi:hypothetical protein